MTTNSGIAELIPNSARSSFWIATAITTMCSLWGCRNSSVPSPAGA